MTNKLVIGSIAGFVVMGALAFTPLAVNAQTALHQAGSGNGISLHDGSGGMNGGTGGGYQASLDTRAKALGMTSTELTEALKTKTMDQIMQDKNVSADDFQAKMSGASKARWEAKGLSAEEVNARIAWQNSRHETATHDGTMQTRGGYGQQNR